MQINLMLAHALNQRGILNWVPVPTLEIKGEIFFCSRVQFASLKALIYHLTKCHYFPSRLLYSELHHSHLRMC